LGEGTDFCGEASSASHSPFPADDRYFVPVEGSRRSLASDMQNDCSDRSGVNTGRFLHSGS
jgi:hypothetical protein